MSLRFKAPFDDYYLGLLRLLLAATFSGTQLDEICQLLRIPDFLERPDLPYTYPSNKSERAAGMIVRCDPGQVAALVEMVLGRGFVQPGPTPPHLEKAVAELRTACVEDGVAGHATSPPSPPRPSQHALSQGRAPQQVPESPQASVHRPFDLLDAAPSLGKPTFEYDVTLSFAGEDREYVKAVADRLRSHGVKVFYDEYEEANLWGKDLHAHLDEVYRQQARYCLVFLSAHYVRKAWPRHELRSAFARAVEERREYVLPARFDDTDVPGLPPTVAYIDLRGKTPEQFASIVLAKLRGGGSFPRNGDQAGYRIEVDGSRPQEAKTADGTTDDSDPGVCAAQLDALVDRLESQPGISVADWRRVDDLVRRLEPKTDLYKLYRAEGDTMAALSTARKIARRVRAHVAAPRSDTLFKGKRGPD